MDKTSFLPHPDSVRRDTAFGPIVQLAYHAPDIERAVDYWAEEHGAGPFFLLEHVQLKSSLHRGKAVPFDHSSAYGQLGDVMIELIHQHDDAPSAIRDMYGAQTPGLHHAAVFVEDVQAALDGAAAKGYAAALDARMENDFRFAMVDARSDHGHMIEFYTPVETLRGFYGFVAEQANDWDGKDVLRRLG